MESIQEKIEDKIIDLMNEGSEGRLIIFKPEKSKFGEDLSVERRGKYKESPLFFQINSFLSDQKEKKILKDFPRSDFKSDRNFYLLFVCFDGVKQKINDYIWLIPSMQFRDIAEDGNLLRFEASLDLQEKNQFSKFLVKIKDLGDLTFNAFEKGGFIFREADFGEQNKINLERLREFIIEARRNTYAGDATASDNPRLLGSMQLEFQKGDYFYRDIFFNGEKKFIGQEIIYQNSRAVWGMSYMGDRMGKLETNFLKESLFKLSERCRLGQFCEYEKRELKYQDSGQGNLEEFSGQEQIFLNKKNIYKLIYQGGLI